MRSPIRAYKTALGSETPLPPLALSFIEYLPTDIGTTTDVPLTRQEESQNTPTTRLANTDQTKRAVESEPEVIAVSTGESDVSSEPKNTEGVSTTEIKNSAEEKALIKQRHQ